MSNEKDMSPVLTENKFTEFYNNYIYPYLNGAAHTGFTPVGTVISYFGETAPENYLVCDGTAYNKTDYPELWTLLSSLTDTTPYVVSGDNTKFKVPDLRGEFLRGTGTNGHTDQGSGANVGVHQDATSIPFLFFDNNDKNIAILNGNSGAKVDVENYDTAISGNNKLSYITTTSVDGVTGYSHYNVRPTNTSVLYCIAYKNIYIDAVIGGENTVITNPQEGQGLVYDGTNGVWKNGAGGLHEYSTTEKVVGKWIDGKPLYEKTIEFNDSLPKDAWTRIVSLPSGCEVVGLVDGVAFLNGELYPINNSYIRVVVNNGGSSGLNTVDVNPYINYLVGGYITLQYTKTTDTV